LQNILFRTGLAAVAAATLTIATPAAAQLTIYEDYTPSDGVIEMTLVKVDEGMMDTYFEGLRGTWVTANEVAKELGHIEDYGIYAVPYGDNEGFNLVLTIRMANTADVGPSKDRYDAFMKAWGDANIAESNKTVRELYNKIRTIKGTYLLRSIDIPKAE
jgi:hypothetical protein